MVVQNYQPKKTSESDSFFNVATDTIMANRKTVNSELLCKSVTWILFLSLFILNIILLLIAMNKSWTINRLHDQVNTLQHDVDMLKYRFFDDSLLKELSQFEKESYADESQNDDDFGYYGEDEEMNMHMDMEVRSKRETMTATLDGIPIITESYAEQKRRNATIGTSSRANSNSKSGLVTTAGDGLRLYESLGKNTPAPHKHHSHTSGWTARTYVNHGRSGAMRPTPLVSRTSRVMHTDKAFRKVVKKALQEHVESAHMTVLPPNTDAGRRGHRHSKRRNANLMETADVVGAHYYGNTSYLEAGKHHGYRGNGHLAHPQGLYVNWETSSWVKAVGADRVLQLQQGEVVVRETGLYLVYAQIYYVDEHDLNGFKIVRNDAELAQCTTMTHTDRKMDKRNTCWTATLARLDDGDRVSVRDIETHRYAYMAFGKSFFGLFKLADLKQHQSNAHTIK